MNKRTTILAFLFAAAYSGLAHELTNLPPELVPEEINELCSAHEAIPTFYILPADVVQDSVRRMVSSDDKLAVGWTYTEAAALKMLAFNEAHEGEKVCTVIGLYEFTGEIFPFRPGPGCATYSQWKAGWLQHRTDKVFGVSEDDAKKIIAGLKGQKAISTSSTAGTTSTNHVPATTAR